MTSLRDSLNSSLKVALRSHDEQRKAVLRGALAALKQAEVDGQQELDEQAVQAILQKEVKAQREFEADAEKAGRHELIETAWSRIAILEEFLPQQLSRDEIAGLARVAISESGATSPRDMSAVMKILMPQVKGLSDGKAVSSVVGELLKAANA